MVGIHLYRGLARLRCAAERGVVGGTQAELHPLLGTQLAEDAALIGVIDQLFRGLPDRPDIRCREMAGRQYPAAIGRPVHLRVPTEGVAVDDAPGLRIPNQHRAS